MIESYGARNDHRLQAYHRLDVGVDFKKRRGRRERTTSVGFYNVYNRKNPFFISLYDLYTEVRDNPFAEPVRVHTNVDHGFGIFAGFNRYLLEVDF